MPSHADDRPRRLRLRLLQALVVACGLASIVGSGGGMLPDIDLTGCCTLPSATIEPPVRTVTVGERVTFTARVFFATAPVRYQWRRNGVDIGGAHDSSYTLAGANLGDDGAQFAVEVVAANGSATAMATLQVSPYPAVVFEDGEFVAAEWSATVAPLPPQGGPTVTVLQSAGGGLPGAYRSIRYDMSAGPSAASVFHLAAAARYEPSTLGAIYAIDFSVDCNKTGAAEIDAGLLLEQGGRRFAGALQACTIDWAIPVARTSLRAADFRLLDGPACAAGESCPDFGAGAQALRFGVVTAAQVPAGQPAASFLQGVDNWRVSVWRR